MDAIDVFTTLENRRLAARRDQAQRDLLAEYEAETDPYLRDVLASEIQYESGLTREAGVQV